MLLQERINDFSELNNLLEAHSVKFFILGVVLSFRGLLEVNIE